MAYLMPKPSLLKNSSDTNSYQGGDKEVHAFSKCISVIENIIA